MSLFSPVASPITALSPLTFPLSSSVGAGGSVPDGSAFGDALQNAISDVNTKQVQAGALAQDFAVGRTSDVQGVMIASQQATIALELATEVRNKAVEAYQEVMRISM